MASNDGASYGPMGDEDHPLPQALLELNTVQAQRLAAGFLAPWPRAVVGLLAEAYNQVEANAAQELKRCTLDDSGRLQTRLEQELLARLNPMRRTPKLRLIDFERLSLTPEEELEEKSALTSLANTFEFATGTQGLQARMQLASTARRLVAPALAEAMAAEAPVAAWLASLRALGVGLQGRLLALRPFEHLALPLWVEWQAAAAELCARPQMGAPEPNTRSRAPPALSAQARASLKAAANVEDGGADAWLAAELLSVEKNQHPARAALVAFHDWFDAIKAEPQLPSLFHGEWEALRLGLGKAALSDDTFFTAVDHPLRSGASAVCLRAALTLPGLVSGAQVRSNMRALLAEAAANTGDVLALLREKQALSAAETAAFAAHAERESKSRLDALLDTVRHAALERGGERKLPPAALPVFHSGLMPILATAWLRDGSGSAAEREALALLAKWQQSRSAVRPSLLRNNLKFELQAAWINLGVDAMWIDGLLRLLDDAWLDNAGPGLPATSDTESEIDALLSALEASIPPPVPVNPAASPAGAAKADARAQLFVKGRWLRIASGSNGAARFLSVTRFDAAMKTVQLSTATGEIAMSCGADELIQDLFAGKAELLNPNPETQALLNMLRS